MGLAAVGLAGCGNWSPAPGADDASPPLLPHIGSGGAAADSAATMSAEVGADAALMPMRAIEYRAAEGATAPAQTAPAYRFLADGTDVVARVKDALGEPGQVQGTDGRRWFYDSASGIGSGTAVACAPDGGECAAPPPPPGVPSASEAEARMRKTLAALGVDASTGAITVSGDDDAYQRQATFVPRIDGQPVDGLALMLALGENGRLLYASGMLGRVEKIGDYPLVSLAEAVKRFGAGGSMGGGVQTLEARSSVMPVEPGGGTGAGAGPPPGVQPPSTDEPPAPTPEPEIVEVTGAELALVMVWPQCEDGEIVLVPAFRLLPLDRAGAEVVAVQDSSMADPAAAVSSGPCPGQPQDLPASKPEPMPAPAPLPAEPARP